MRYELPTLIIKCSIRIFVRQGNTAVRFTANVDEGLRLWSNINCTIQINRRNYILCHVMEWKCLLGLKVCTLLNIEPTASLTVFNCVHTFKASKHFPSMVVPHRIYFLLLYGGNRQ